MCWVSHAASSLLITVAEEMSLVRRAAIQVVPSVKKLRWKPSTATNLLRNADLPNSISDRPALSRQYFDLLRLQDDLFRFASLSSHLLALLKSG